MNYITIKTNDIAAGPGVRVSLFVSGCRRHCKGCHNPESWAFDAGKEFDESAYQIIKENLERPEISGLSLLGGEPLEPENEPGLLALVKRLRSEIGRISVLTYTGFKYESVKDRPLIIESDAIIDGEYIESERNLMLAYRGSNNQRYIEKETL